MSDGEGFIAAVGLGEKGRCDNWKFRASDGEDLLNEYYNGHSGVKIFDPFSRADGPIDFEVERVNGRAACLGLLHTLDEQPTDGPDKLVGTSGDDVIAGLAGNDIGGTNAFRVLLSDSWNQEAYKGLVRKTRVVLGSSFKSHHTRLIPGLPLCLRVLMVSPF